MEKPTGTSRQSSSELIQLRAVAYAREAGRMAMAHYRSPLDITYKSKRMRDPVTSVDREVEAYLRASIARDFPEHGILGEEGTNQGPESSEFWWVLDPLDGTTNFINGLPFFAVSIGVLHNLEPAVAAIFSPGTHLGTEGVYHAARGGGAFLDGSPLQIQTTDVPISGRLASVPGSYSGRFKADRELRKRHGEPRVMGSVALELALTAGNVFQFAVFGSPKIWDVAAGILVLSEAGGRVMASSKGGEWEGFKAFVPGEMSRAEQAGNLREWSRSIIAGSPPVVGFLAEHLSLRPKSEARGRSGTGPATGRPDPEL